MAIAHARSVDALRRRGRHRQREQDDSEAPEYASETVIWPPALNTSPGKNSPCC
jgi:DNA-directed RNA polymerase specialized sigma24 family protein